jgi:hypothetical protein
MKRWLNKRCIGCMVVHWAVFVCLLSAARIAKAQPSPTSGTGAVEGVVYCADTKQPARFATIRVQLLSSIGSTPSSTRQTPPDAAMTVTDLNGAFFIDHLSPGEYVALASLRGYVYPLEQFSWKELTVDTTSPAQPVRQKISKTLPHVTIEAGRTSTLALTLERGAEISGTVTYDDGSPAISARIKVYRFSESTHEWQAIEQPPDTFLMMSTDDRGSFRVTEMPPGRYLVSASLPPEGGSSNAILGGLMRFDLGLGFPGRLEVFAGDTVRRKDATAIDLSSGEIRTGVDIQIPLSRFRVLTGTVIAASDGHKLKEAAVQLSFADDKSVYLVAHIGADGKFIIPFVLDGEYILTVSAAPEDGSPKHSYKIVSLPINVDEDVNGLSIALPDAPP